MIVGLPFILIDRGNTFNKWVSYCTDIRNKLKADSKNLTPDQRIIASKIIRYGLAVWNTNINDGEDLRYKKEYLTELRRFLEKYKLWPGKDSAETIYHFFKKEYFDGNSIRDYERLKSVGINTNSESEQGRPYTVL